MRAWAVPGASARDAEWGSVRTSVELAALLGLDDVAGRDSAVSLMVLSVKTIHSVNRTFT